MFRAIAASPFGRRCSVCDRRRKPPEPERTVTIVTPFAPGGIADVVARLTAERLQVRAQAELSWWRTISGAGGTAGPERVSKATPDGYTLMSTPIFQLTTAKYAQNVYVRRRTRFQADLWSSPRRRSRSP